MKNKIFTLLVLFFCLVSRSHAGGSSPAEVITTFLYFNGHVGLLVIQPTMINPDNCERSDFYMLQKDHPYYKEITALILGAHFSGQPLAFGLEGCAQGLPRIQNVASFK